MIKLFLTVFKYLELKNLKCTLSFLIFGSIIYSITFIFYNSKLLGWYDFAFNIFSFIIFFEISIIFFSETIWYYKRNKYQVLLFTKINKKNLNQFILMQIIFHLIILIIYYFVLSLILRIFSREYINIFILLYSLVVKAFFSYFLVVLGILFSVILFEKSMYVFLYYILSLTLYNILFEIINEYYSIIQILRLSSVYKCDYWFSSNWLQYYVLLVSTIPILLSNYFIIKINTKNSV
ncbi:hypothetical protein SLITO_v1c01270 [Spiroplasma litorale]|uniref:Uncharacterized protein n=1 Tax=Spiroplasma litorale TaxID=216942 RepID=A0A0K1W0G6_9MOLU|nr:hypothetical protein SLITO_v1c01270 [Spiroplasma litorale]